MTSPAERDALNSALLKLAGGDRAAARPAFDLLWPPVRAFCARALGDASSDDAAQRTLAKLFEQVADFSPERDGLAWAVEIAIWECRTELRRRSRSREAAWDEERARRVAHESAPPDELLGKEQLRVALKGAMEELSEVDRETLRALLAEDPRAIGSATWRKRKQRALNRLKQTWKVLYGE